MTIRRWPQCVLLAFALGAPRLLGAQSEAALKEYFEGKRVAVKIAMPGTESGVDIYPMAARPLDYTRYADRLKDNGTAIKPGEQALVTKIKVKAKLIEFQLDGGGYGTAGDETSSNVSVSPAPKTKREQNLEAELKRETDPARKRAMKEELDELRADREREDARNRAAVAEAEEQRKANIRQRRLEGGSRFNLRYSDRVPASALMPEGVKHALAQYVEFEPSGPTVTLIDTQPRPAPRSRLPHKGMLLEEADELMGAPVKTTQRPEGKLKVVTRSYRIPDGRVMAEFVEGVLIRYTVSSD